MVSGKLRPVIHYLARATDAGGRELSDGQLLLRFVEQGEESAFATLLCRHASMVFNVCRRVLQDEHDAEDAFQATFLLLARKAGSLRQPESLAPWLHGVAHRTAMKTRTGLARRRLHERRAGRHGAEATDHTCVWAELQPVLDEAIQRLPQKYRVPVILCYLEGRSNVQAARQLGCPTGTVATRLARARERLRTYLIQRGLSLPAAGIAFLLSREVVSARVSASLLHATTTAAGAFAAGKVMPPGTASSRAVVLAEGVQRAMQMDRLRLWFVSLVMMGVVGVGTGLLGFHELSTSLAGESVSKGANALPPTGRQPADASPEKMATHRTTNFLVEAPTVHMARQIGRAAERQRKELALLWLGKELAAWPEPCPIRVEGRDRSAGGMTVMTFSQGQVQIQSMHLEGPLEDILASTLPHEMSHVIFAHALGAPLPRWADEGGAMLAEDDRNHQGHVRLLHQAWQKGKALELRRLFARNDYPETKDLPLFFAQSCSVARFLVETKDRRTFLALLAIGKRAGWDKAARDSYGFENVEALERAWIANEKPLPRPSQPLHNHPDDPKVKDDQKRRVDLEQKIDSLQKQLDELRRELQSLPPSPEGARPEQAQLQINQRKVRIPFNLDPPQKGHVKELLLYSSPDQGKSWSIAGKSGPDQESFTFQADRDGTYWFHVAIVDDKGKQQPNDILAMPPSLRVVVDTVPPAILVTRTERMGAEVAVTFAIREDHPNLDTLKLEYRTPMSAWQPIRASLPQDGKVVFRPGGKESVSVRISMMDLAGNQGTVTAEIDAQ